MNLPVKTSKGLHLFYRPGTTDEKVIPEVIDHHCYTRKDFAISPYDYWADLGANIGTFSLLVAQAGSRSIAYEPEPENFAILQSNIAANRFQDRILPFNSAVTLGGEDAVLFTCKSARNKYRHSVLDHKGWNPVSISSTPFSAIMQSGVDCIKMDIEGSELPILDRFDLSGIKKLTFEYHFDVDRSIEHFLKRIERLSRWFTRIYYAKLPVGKETYDFFPAARIVYCQA